MTSRMMTTKCNSSSALYESCVRSTSKGEHVRGATLQTYAAFLIFSLALVVLNGCGNSQNASNQTASQAQATPTPRDDFERKLQFIRQGHFTYTYAFARKDGGVIDKDDAAYLRKYAARVVDFVVTDDGRRAIAGMNFELEAADMDALRKRFNVEDYSGK